MTITTPALLFSAISLLMLAYTNKFLTLAQIVRQLVHDFPKDDDSRIKGQIKNLNLRLTLIKYMQGFGALSFLFCTLSMFSLFLTYLFIGEILFAIGLILLGVSLVLLFYEVTISTKALKIELENISINK
ncbi:DUF2721 domain-containing protein [Thiospirochaeta perfilievii]|uniref:DUF2721 domain-containing protein n=1 Tax=Thiospirochaeta perfilievii TaxID=252967 RepID=A0A5C1QEP4_9SPIO|nr:DUF2721 domain-containing protein [Thiospirochaeta perfilievii]QEN05479.1 DUF2721 domain-containing protein [Thiospirochaeta perfilievii]